MTSSRRPPPPERCAEPARLAADLVRAAGAASSAFVSNVVALFPFHDPPFGDLLVAVLLTQRKRGHVVNIMVDQNVPASISRWAADSSSNYTA